MAAIQPTSSGDVEGSAPVALIDYTELLRVSLKQQKLLYISDIILEVEEVPLNDLLEWTRANISELLDEIHNNDDNNHKIKVSHRNKFAKTVIEIGKSKKQSISNNNIPAAPSSSKMKLLIIGKEEEECIEAIQCAQQYMNTSMIKIKELYNNENKNNELIKNKLQSICNELKKQIDIKQKEVINIIDSIHKYKINELDKRNDVTQKSVAVVAKFYSEYENYFNDDKLTKQDRKSKLIAAKQAIHNETQKIAQYKDMTYDIDVNVNKNISNQFFAKSINLCNIGVDIPAVNPQIVGTTIKWQPPVVNKIKTVLQQNGGSDNDDNKENKENEPTIVYQILYRKQIDINDDEKKQNEEEWYQIDNLVNTTEYDMRDIDFLWEAKMVYNIHNILSSESDVVRGYIAKWFTEYKGNRITLSDNNTKALMAEGDDQSVRAQYPISKGMIVKLNFIFYYPNDICDEIFGVVSSECNNGNYNTYLWESGCELLKYSYGLQGRNNSTHYYGKQKDLGWTNITIPKGEEVTIQMIVDYATYDTCCLSYYINGQFQGPKNAKYSMKLPKLKNNHVWYPIVCFDYDDNWCKMECV